MTKRGTPKAAAPKKVKRAREDRGEYRSIYVSMIDSPEYLSLSAEARAILWPMKMKLGRAGIDVFYLEGLPRASGYPSDVCEKAVRELVSTKWLVVQGSLIWLRNGLRFDPSDPLASPNGRKGIVNFLRTLPKWPIINEFVRYYRLEQEWQESAVEEPPALGACIGAYQGASVGATEGGGVAGNRDEGIGMREDIQRKTDSTSLSPTLDVQQPPQVYADTAPTGASTASAGEGLDDLGSVAERDDAIATMTTEFNVTVQDLPDLRRNAFRAAVRPIINGSDTTSWRDPRSGGDRPIPWSERPRIFELAIATVVSEGRTTAQAVASAIAYQARRTLDPYPVTPKPPAGSPAAAYHGQNRKSEYPKSNGARGESFAGLLEPDDKAAAAAAKAEAERIADERAVEWLRSKPHEAERIGRAIDAEFELSRTYWNSRPQQEVEERRRRVLLDRALKILNERQEVEA
jgi:hypothetical protein